MVGDVCKPSVTCSMLWDMIYLESCRGEVKNAGVEGDEVGGKERNSLGITRQTYSTGGNITQQTKQM